MIFLFPMDVLLYVQYYIDQMLFKISYMSETHLLSPADQLKFEELVEFIQNMFKDLPETFVLTYFDSDQDEICLSCQGDMEMLQCQPIEKVQIQISTEQQKKTQVFQNLDIESSFESSSISSFESSIFSEEKAQRKGQLHSKNHQSHIPIVTNNSPQNSFLNNSFDQQFQDDNFNHSPPSIDQIHTNYMCDGCETQPIIGTRYKCSICADFDLCSKCQSLIDHEHPFLKIKNIHQTPKEIHVVLPETKPKQNEGLLQKIKGVFYSWIGWNSPETEKLNLDIPLLRKESQKKINCQENIVEYIASILGKDIEKCYRFVQQYPGLRKQQILIKYLNNPKTLE